MLLSVQLSSYKHQNIIKNNLQWSKIYFSFRQAFTETFVFGMSNSVCFRPFIGLFFKLPVEFKSLLTKLTSKWLVFMHKLLKKLVCFLNFTKVLIELIILKVRKIKSFLLFTKPFMNPIICYISNMYTIVTLNFS